MSDQVFVLTKHGEEVAVGTVDERRAALADVARVTGGSSWRGRWSAFFGFDGPQNPWRGPPERLAFEAADLLATLGEQLNDETRAFLGRLVQLLEAPE